MKKARCQARSAAGLELTACAGVGFRLSDFSTKVGFGRTPMYPFFPARRLLSATEVAAGSRLDGMGSVRACR